MSVLQRNTANQSTLAKRKSGEKSQSLEDAIAFFTKGMYKTLLSWLVNGHH